MIPFLLADWPLFLLAAIILFITYALAFCAGISIGERNLANARRDAFLEGRRSERADNARESLP